MRIAFAGSHRVGKTTLAERVAETLSDHELVEEPYLLMEDEGHEFAHPPDLQDYEDQLERSLRDLAASGPHTVFDRSPADLLAYLAVAGGDVDDWLGRVRHAMSRLDLVVLVPIEVPDRIVLGSDEDPGLRAAVDEQLAQLLVEDDLAPELLVVHGDLGSRLAQVLAIVEPTTDA